jgi:feruloyl esterase
VKNYLARDPGVDSIDYVPYDQNLPAMLALAALNDATATDLRPFSNSGGKLILWHGGNDAALSVNATAEYYAAVATAVGGQPIADSFVRFYVAPGANHCSGGPGADDADLLGALDAWVTRATPPETLTARKLGAISSRRNRAKKL